MASKDSSISLAQLVINKVESQTAYDQMVSAGQINENELYLVEGDIVPEAYTSNPEMDGTASPGSSLAYAKGDHVHPSDTTRAPVSHATSTATYGAGTGTNYGHLRLSDSTSSTSGTSGGYAATPSAVKSAYDLANGKQDPLSATQLVWYGTSSTSGGTQTKTTSITGISSLASGLCVRIKFSNAQTYNGQPKLQINSLTATNIVRMGTTAAARYEWQSGEVVDFVYDGTNFVIQDGATATTTYYGQTVLSSATNSTSETVAATSKAVNDVMSAIPSASTTTPSMDGTASYGSGTTWARADHVHPTDTSRASASDLTSHINNTSNPHSVTASQVGAAPTSHASSATTYGTGTSSNYGHWKLSDSTSSTSGTSGGIAATPSAVKAAYDLANGKQDPITVATTVESGNANPVSSGAVYTALQSAGKTYTYTFTTSNWSSQAITLNASTHGCGTAPLVQVQTLNGTSYEMYYGFPSTGWKVAIDASGNITLSVPASGDEFAGRMVIR